MDLVDASLNPPRKDGPDSRAKRIDAPRLAFTTAMAATATPTACLADRVASTTTAGVSFYAEVKPVHRSTRSTFTAIMGPSTVRATCDSGLACSWSTRRNFFRTVFAGGTSTS